MQFCSSEGLNSEKETNNDNLKNAILDEMVPFSCDWGQFVC